MICVCVCFKHFWSSEQTSRLWRFVPVTLESVGVVLLIPTEGRLNCPECRSGSAPLLFSQCWQRDDVDESRAAGLKTPTETSILVLGQKILFSRYPMRNPYVVADTWLGFSRPSSLRKDAMHFIKCNPWATPTESNGNKANN